MDPKIKDLEMIFNLQWKNKPPTANGGERSNIIGVYDIPGTTLNWDLFKSYLLKNSGTNLDDVTVHYVTSNDGEYQIESNTDFQIALYAFRRKARNNEFINLNLNRVVKPDPKQSPPKHRCIDVETQSDTVDSASTPQSLDMAEASPPAWFTVFMAQFKQDLMDEVKTVVTDAVAGLQPSEPVAAPPQPHFPQQLPLPESHSWRKCKSDAKRVRKSALPSSHVSRQQNERELMKSIKIERKLESKLEKLENKTKKLREKKLALISKSTSDSDGGPTCSNKRFDRKRNYPMPPPPTTTTTTNVADKPLDEEDAVAVKSDQEPIYEMDAKVLTKERPMFFQGGEMFCWTWVVQNTGLKPWTGDTSVIFTWGSKALQPVQYTIACPRLMPGETGKIINLLQIPCQKGKYECYYHFHHKDRRFGQCLSCQIYVDPMGKHEIYEAEVEKIEAKAKAAEVEECQVAGAAGPVASVPEEDPPKKEYPYDMEKLKSSLEQPPENKGTVNAEIKKEHDTYCTSDSDNQSDGSESDEGFKDEFVVVPVPDCFKINHERHDYTQLIQMAYQTSQASSRPQPSTNCYRVDSMDLFVDWPKTAETASAQDEAAGENFDDNNNTASRSPSVTGMGDSDAGSNQSDTVVIVRNNAEDGYAYVEVNGKGLHVPRKILKSEYIEKLETPDKTKTPSTISIASSSVVVINDDDDTQTEQIADVPEDGHEPVVVKSDSQQQQQQQQQPQTTVPTTQLISLQPEEQNNLKPSAPINTAAADPAPSHKTIMRGFVFPRNAPGFEVTPTLFDHFQQQEPQQPVPEMMSSTSSNPFSPVPNYQQTVPELRLAPDPQLMAMLQEAQAPSDHQAAAQPSPPAVQQPQQQQPAVDPNPVHILPETLVSGAVNVASSAINTARSVINMIVPPQWVVGPADRHAHEANLQVLAEMGFWDQDLNLALLIKHNGDLGRVVTELIL